MRDQKNKHHKNSSESDGDDSIKRSSKSYYKSEKESDTTNAAQLKKIADTYVDGKKPVQRKSNNTGLPDQLKSNMENISGYSMDDVKVHYNSNKPAQLQAHAYAQGNQIHLASGQEKHLPHEAWHVIQQKQGRVKPTTKLGGNAINDDTSLEKEADVMGAKATQLKLDPDQKIVSKDASSNVHQLISKRGASNVKDGTVNVYNIAGEQVGTLISHAEFDFNTDNTELGNHEVGHEITAMNRDDYIETTPNDGASYVSSKKVISRQGMGTYANELATQSGYARATTDRLRAGRQYSEHDIGSILPQLAERGAACYNFAVGSLRTVDNSGYLQRDIPAYVRRKYGGDEGFPLPQEYLTGDFPNLSGAQMTAINALMVSAGMSIDYEETGENPPFDSAEGRVLTTRLKVPLQKYILRESGLRPNPDGNWAVGFRANPWELGSHHAWVQAINPDNPNLYMTFDTFPDEESIVASRKRHSDPWQDEDGAVDYVIRITGPTAPQWNLIRQIPDVAFDEDLDGGDASNDRSIHPQDDEYVAPED